MGFAKRSGWLLTKLFVQLFGSNKFFNSDFAQRKKGSLWRSMFDGMLPISLR